MGAVLGVIFHAIGGFASGSFYIPFKKVRNWAWESFWIVGGLFSWMIVPFIAAWLTVPGLMAIIGSSPDEVVFWTYAMGFLWGIGGLTFGLGIRYLGVSLGQSVALGFTSAFGALLPPIYRDVFTTETEGTFSAMLHHVGGRWVLAGVAVCLLGIYLCGKAGVRKERELDSPQQRRQGNEVSVRKGLVVAIVSGILSACFNYGIEAGKPLAQAAELAGANPLFRNNVSFVIILWGGLTTNLIWCLMLNARNRTFRDYVNPNAPLARNYLFSALAGTTWFLQFFFYGMGESKLGNGASSWILHMAFIILASNLWGMALKEWAGVSRKTFNTILSGIVVIILSVVIVGYGNSLT